MDPFGSEFPQHKTKRTKHMKTQPNILCPVLTVIALTCFALLQNAQAVNPPPDGGYPNFTTAEGTKALQALTTGFANTAVGWFSLGGLTTGSFNTATGAGTLLASTADENTATGAGALLSNTTGPDNTANGAFALFSNTSGGFNTANGDSALFSNTVGAQNTATGFNALQSNASGSSNTANGAYALVNNTTGHDNTANGFEALFGNATGAGNTANGSQALLNSNSNYNTADGFQALYSNINGTFNTATGSQALSGNTSGQANVANGFEALAANTIGDGNTANGFGALAANTIGNGNTALGSGAGVGVTTASGVTCIGVNVAGANVDNTTWIANVYGVATQSGTTAPVIVSDTGQLGTAVSSERFKKDISTMAKTSEAILSLRPVTFRYKSDAKSTPQFGLIAEEVAKVNPALVLPDKEGKPYTVRYEAVNAMLLNEFLKEHRKNEEQEATIAQLKHDFQSRLADQQKQIEVLTTGLQKVSAQLAAASPSRGGLEASKLATGRIRGGGPAPQVVNNP